MSFTYSNVFSNEELEYLNNLPEVLEAKTSLDCGPSGMVYFSVNVTDSIRDSLHTKFGLDVSVGSSIPMRWVKGDTAPHVDVGRSKFENTYLIYLNDSPGEFVVDSQSYAIQANCGFMFNEGLSHKTQNTENVPRLLMGPMNEFAEPVGGGSNISYYPTQADALADTNSFGGSGSSYQVGDGGPFGPGSGYVNWRIASNSTGTSDQTIIYSNGSTLNSGGNYYLYPYFPPRIFYYSTQQDADTKSNSLGFSTTFTVGDGGPFGGYTSWRIASNSIGTSDQSITYSNGDTLDAGFGNEYQLYRAVPCFLEGTQILCQVDGVETYVSVEQLKLGTLVKTSLDGYKKVVLLGTGTIQNPGNSERTENRLYKCSPSKYPQLKEDLYITGCHSILEFPITDKQKEDTIKHLGRLFVTDKKYRLMACVDERAEPWKSEGTYTIWHFALENQDDGMNYGVYVNGELLVETCAIRTLKNKSNMLFIE
jgi:hypothetical protein